MLYKRAAHSKIYLKGPNFNFKHLNNYFIIFFKNLNIDFLTLILVSIIILKYIV